MKNKTLITIAISAFTTAIHAYSQTITFEPDAAGLLPDGSIAKDDMAITDQFQRFGVCFGVDNDRDGHFDENKTLFLEATGEEGTDGFLNNASGVWDEAASGHEARLGKYFLRGSGRDILLVHYATPVRAASCELWDIDGGGRGTEQWIIEILSDSGKILKTTRSPLGLEFELDARPWIYSVERDQTDIKSIRITFIGGKTSGGGVAFNNFSPTTPIASDGGLDPRIYRAVEFSWQSQPNQYYQVQWSSSLEGESD